MRLDRTLVLVRERTFLDIMDLALIVVRRRPVSLAVAGLLGIVPWMMVNAWLTSEAEEAWWVANLLLMAVEAPFATAPLTVVLGGLMFGGRPSVIQGARVLIRRLPQMLVFAGVLRVVMLVSVLLAWLVPLRLPFVNEVILLERGKWGRIYGRCVDLTSERLGDLFSQWATMMCFGGGFGLAFAFALGNLETMIHSEGLTWESEFRDSLIGSRWLAGLWIGVAFFAVVRFLTYLDQRIRLEGWEVELRLRSAAESMRREEEP